MFRFRNTAYRTPQAKECRAAPTELLNVARHRKEAPHFTTVKKNVALLQRTSPPPRKITVPGSI